MTKSPLNSAKEPREHLGLCAELHRHATAERHGQSTPRDHRDTAASPGGRLSDAAWRDLVDLLSQLHAEDLAAALVVLRLR